MNTNSLINLQSADAKAAWKGLDKKEKKKWTEKLEPKRQKYIEVGIVGMMLFTPSSVYEIWLYTFREVESHGHFGLKNLLQKLVVPNFSSRSTPSL